MRIQTNVESLNAYRNLNQTNRAMSRSMERLSSGFRINRAADDAAGLAISEKMRGQISGLTQATRNAQDSTSLIQTAEGALNETHSILQRMRELAVQAANDDNTAEDRVQIQEELNQLTSEINRIGNTTEFNTQRLLDGGGRVDLEATNKFIDGSPEGGDTEHVQAAQTVSIVESNVINFLVETTVLAPQDIDEVALSEGEEYAIEQLDEEFDAESQYSGTGDFRVNYVARNANSEIVGVSQNGEEWYFVEDGEERINLEDIAEGKIIDDHVADFTDPPTPVTSGTLGVTYVGEIEGGYTISATQTEGIDENSPGLSFGTYNVVEIDSDNYEDYFAENGEEPLISTGGTWTHEQIDSILLDANGNVVAVEMSAHNQAADNEYYHVDDVDFSIDFEADSTAILHDDTAPLFQADLADEAILNVNPALEDGDEMELNIDNHTLEIDFVENTSLDSNTIAVDEGSLSGTSVTIEFNDQGGLTTAEHVDEIVEGINMMIGENEQLAGNYAASADRDLSDPEVYTMGGTDVSSADHLFGVFALTADEGGEQYGANSYINGITGDSITDIESNQIGSTTHTAAVYTADFTDNTVETLVGKGFAIDGQQFEFYNSNEGSYTGSATGISLSAVDTGEDQAAQLAEATAYQLNNLLADNENVAEVYAEDNEVVIVAAADGEDGNSSIEVVDGGISLDFHAGTAPAEG